MRVSIVVDIYEREGRVWNALQMLGVATKLDRLPVGDYEAGGAIVERKSVRDLHLSIISGRLWRQLARLRRVASRPYLLVEGDDLDAGPLRPQSVRGALIAISELAVPVIRSADPSDSAAWLKILGERPYRRRRATSALPVAQGASPSEAMLTAVPGISVISARALLSEFGSIADIAAAGPKSWLSVPGIGNARAQALSNAFSSHARIPSRPRSGRPDLST